MVNSTSKRLSTALILLALLSAYSSCIPFRKSSKKPDTTNITTVEAPPKDTIAIDNVVTTPPNAAREELIAALKPAWKLSPDFTTFSGKAKMQYEGRGQKQEFTTVFRIKKDEAIWASVIALGGIVQVARVYITPDSFKLINYLEKEVTVMSLAEAGKVLPAPADFNTLQNLILGTALRTSGTATDATDLGNILSLQVEEDGIIQHINFNKADTTIHTLQLRSTNTGGPSGMISFSGYEIKGARKFPMNRTLNVVSSGEPYSLEMNFNKVDFDLPLDFPFSIPKNYKRK